MEGRGYMNALFRDKKRRIWELDFIRGIAVLAMCFDHAMFDFAYYKSWFSNSKEISNDALKSLSDFARAYWYSGNYDNPGFRFWAHFIFVFVFLFLVGISCALSRDNIKRGAALGIVSVVFSGVTMALGEFGIMEPVVFGILQCISVSILCAAAVDILSGFNKYVNLFAPLVIGLAIVIAGISLRFWEMMAHFDYTFVPEHIYGYVLGTHAYGGDWFGLFPYVGAVLLGMYFGKAAYMGRRSLLPRLDGKWNVPICFVGRHALLFFLAHQVVIAGIFGGICLIIGYRF